MKLDGRQLVLDTNILVHWLRGGGAGMKIRNDYALGARRPRPIVPVVVKAEIKSLARRLKWGFEKLATADALLRELPVADIHVEAVIDAYAELDDESMQLGRRMGKNDLWIAALARVQGAVILTTDQDFGHLHPGFVEVECINVSAPGAAT